MDADLPGTVPEPEDHTAEMQQQLDDLGEIKAKTMYRMVEEVVVRDRAPRCFVAICFVSNNSAPNSQQKWLFRRISGVNGKVDFTKMCNVFQI